MVVGLSISNLSSGGFIGKSRLFLARPTALCTIGSMSPKPVRVTHIHLGQDHGGAETFFIKLAGALSRRGVQQLAIVPQGRIWIPALRAAGCDVVELKPRHKLLSILDNLTIKNLVETYKPQAVMAWMNKAARRMPRGNWVTIARLGGYYPTRFYKKCQHLVGNTPGLVQFMQGEGRPAATTHMISNFPDMKPSAPAQRSAYNTPENVPLLVAMGRLHHSKGFDVLLHALQQIPDAHLWLLGEGEERAKLEELSAQLGLSTRVHFFGWISNPAPYIMAADVFVMPSRHEPLGNVILEAWACGKPVVSTTSEGPSWMVKDGDNGLMVPVDDADALAIAMQRILNDTSLAQKLVAGGNATLAAQFSEDAVCDAYIKLFTQQL